MPTKNPRLSVVLSPSVAATLVALSAETGDSASSLVRGLLEQCAPALERMLELVRAAKAAKGQIGAGASSAMHRVVEDLQDAVALADSRQRRVIDDLVQQAEKVKGRRRPVTGGGAARARPAKGSTPVPVTRGSGRKGKPAESGKERTGKGVRRGRV